jgi:hypothetical protein
MTSRILLVACFMLVSFLAYSSTQKTEATCSSETAVYFQRTTLRYIPENRTLHNHCCGNLNCYIQYHRKRITYNIKDISYNILELLRQSLGHFLHSTPLTVTVKSRRRNLELLLFLRNLEACSFVSVDWSFRVFWPVHLFTLCLLLPAAANVHTLLCTRVCLFVCFAFLYQLWNLKNPLGKQWTDCCSGKAREISCYSQLL